MSIKPPCFFVGTIVTLWMPLPNAMGQIGTVQQPVVGRFSASTTVSVPDRGRAFLAGVSRAADSRNRYGSFPRGSSLGRERQSSNISVGVYIHDFRAMDEYLLNQKTRTSSGPRLNGHAENAYQSLLKQYRQRSLSSSAGHRISTVRNAERFQPSNRSRRNSALAEKYYAKGTAAEKRGRNSTAQIFFRIAAKYGSVPAAKKLSISNDGK